MSNKSAYELNMKVIQPLIKKYKKTRDELKKKIKDPNISAREKLELVGKLAKLPRRSSSIAFNRRCNLTYRSRSVDRFTGLNYFQVRLLASRGRLPGFIRATW